MGRPTKEQVKEREAAKALITSTSTGEVLPEGNEEQLFPSVDSFPATEALLPEVLAQVVDIPQAIVIPEGLKLPIPNDVVVETAAQISDKKKPSFQRDRSGLVVGLDYPFDAETGLVNWRELIKREFVVANASKFPEGTVMKDIDIDDLEDNQLLILLGGIKELAQIRGFSEVVYKVHEANPNYVAVTCSITWIPNFETGGREVRFEAMADAHADNTKSFARDFLMAIAENRSFVRAVRNFLRINIVGSDEIGDKKNAVVSEESAAKPLSSSDPLNVLIKLMNAASIGFDTIKARLVTEGIEGAADWTDIKEIPKDQIFKLIERIKKKVK